MKLTRTIVCSMATALTLFTFIPASKLLAADAARVAGNLKVEGLVFSGDTNNTVITNPSQMGPWSLITPQGSNTNAYFGLTGGNVGIGTATPSEQLELTGNIKLPATTATSGIIKQNGQTLMHTYGTANLFVGGAAGNFSLTGENNTGLGYATLNSNTTGVSNVAAGAYAMYSNTTGNENTAIGAASLISNTSGHRNTGSGVGALQSNTTGLLNSAHGHNALNENITGSGNTAVGSSSLSGNITGINNTAIGAYAGETNNLSNTNISGSNNLFLGYKSGPGTATQLDYSTAIGAYALVSQSNSMVLGGTGLYAVKVGIGTTTPTVQLDVVGDAKISGTLTTGTSIAAASGGTGLDSSGTVAGSIFKTTGTGTWGTLAPGSEGQTLKMSGGSPTWSSSAADATGLFRVLGTAGITWPTNSTGLEFAHNSTSNQAFLQSYDRVTSQWGTMAINASTVTIGGTPGNLAVSGVISGNGSGLTNVTPVQGIAGPVDADNNPITKDSPNFVFVGPTVTVTTTASQHIVGSMTAVLGITSNLDPALYFSFDFGICYRQNATLDAPVTLTPNYTTADIPNEVGRKPYATSMTRVPGAGTWEVGYCVRNASTADFDDNDYVNGWIMTTN